MKILVISDSHENHKNIAIAMENEKHNLNFVFGLGDNSDDFIGYPETYPNIEFKIVNGNCDYGKNYSSEIITQINGIDIWLTHGHRSGVKSGFEKLIANAKERKVNICLFGHTHQPQIFLADDICFLNPGSLSLPKGELRNPSYSTIEIISSSKYKIKTFQIFENGFTELYKEITFNKKERE